MKIIFIKSPSGAPFNLAHFVGDTVDVKAKKQAQELIDQGFAVAADIEETGKKARPRKAASQKPKTES